MAEAYRPDPPSPAGVNFFLTLMWKSHHIGSLLISVIQGRLPRDILIDIGKEMKLEHGGVWNLETLMGSLKLEIETRECVQTKGSFKESSSDTRKPGYGKNTSIPQTSAALLGGNSAPDCTFCRGKHPSFDCHVVTNLQERKNILPSQNRKMFLMS